MSNMFIQIVVLILAASTTSSRTIEHLRIIGGKPAEIGQFPYQCSVRLKLNGVHICGCSIMSEKMILTAAHCANFQTNTDLIVYMGTNYIEIDDPNLIGDSYEIKEILMHPAYRPGFLYNDLCLMQTTHPIQFNKLVQPISVASLCYDNEEAIISGWGHTSTPNGSASRYLQYLIVETISLTECRNRTRPGLRPFIQDNNICTFSNLNIGVCNGDSGGPLISIERNEIIGLVSWGECGEITPDVYTGVCYHKDWILEMINKYK